MENSGRRHLEDERKATTRKFTIGGQKAYVTVGMYPDGKPGEIFIVMSKEGSTMSGLVDTSAIALSLALQYGVPVKAIVAKLASRQFEPMGMTNYECVPCATSITDLIARWLGILYLDLDTLKEVGVLTKCHECNQAVRHNRKVFPCKSLCLPSTSPPP